MLRIELTEPQVKVARWVIDHVRLNFLDCISLGMPNLLHELPVIQGRVLLLSNEVLGEGSVADEFCHVLNFDFKNKGHLDFGFDKDGICAHAGKELYRAILRAERETAR